MDTQTTPKMKRFKSRIDAMPEVEQSANAVTDAAIEYLNLRGHFVWRQNNLAVRGRRFTGLKGVPDIIGMTKDGRFLGVEVKVGRDVQSDAQKIFQVMTTNRKGIYTVINKVDQLVEAGL